MKQYVLIGILIFFMVFCLTLGGFFLYYMWPRNVEMFGQSFPRDSVIIDLTDCPIEDSSDWVYSLVKFDNLKTVRIDNKKINKNEREYWKSLYPNVFFDVDVTINVYGTEMPEETKSLDFSDVNIDEKILTLLGEFPYLEKVKFSTQEFNHSTQLELIEKYPNVDFEWNVEIAGRIERNDIEELDLSNVTITDKLEFEKALRLLPNLKKLDLCDCSLKNEEMAELREKFPNVKITWKIYLGKWSLRTDAVAFSVLITRFDYKRMTSKDIEVLKYCTDLQALDLGHQAITDISVITDNLPDLRLLILADNKISDIKPLTKLKHLHYVELFLNPLYDISPLTSCKELVDVNFCNTYVSDISSLVNDELPLLERLWITNCRISQNGYKQLRDKYPKVTFCTTGTSSTASGWRTHKRYYTMIDMFNKRNYISELFTKYDT